MAKSENEQEVTGILNDLYRRGLEGKNLRLIASDGAKGIRAAISMVYPYAKWEESKELITDSRLRGNDILESAHNS
ncbi:MAG: transposase [Candidatus Omnitrophota bacterium]